MFFAMAAEARRIGIPFAGHLSQFVTPTEASDSGQRSLEHFTLSLPPCTLWPYNEMTGFPPERAIDTTGCAALAQRFVRNGTWFTPTLALQFASSQGTERRHVMDLVGMMYRAGVPMLTGTDVVDGRGRPAPGVALHEELAFLTQSGLTPLAALRAATLNPARYWGATDSLGTVAPGKLADLVLLDANPLADIGNATKIHAVVMNGRYLDRAALDALLAEAMPRWKHDLAVGGPDWCAIDE